MRSRDVKQRLSIIKLLGVGGVILLVCLAVCVFMVSLLQNTYREELSERFQEDHESAGEVLDNMISSMNGVLDAAVETIKSGNQPITDARIMNIVEEYEAYYKFTDLAYVSADGYSYKKKEKTYVKTLPETDRQYIEEILDSAAAYSKVITAEDAENRVSLILAKPVLQDFELKGFFVAYIDITDMFEEKAFNQQKKIGECYLLDGEGKILLRSSDAVRIEKNEKDFQIGILKYTGGSEADEQSLQNAINELKKGKKGFISLKTMENNSLQISYSCLSSVKNIYFVSFYDDNLVDDSIHPLIINSVISCTVIIVLMVIVILFVWSSAKNANMTIEKLAYEDPVTKGRNLNFFKEFAVSTLNVYREIPFVIYRFDIANFRYINEAYGHQKADEVLKSCIQNFEVIFAENELCVRMNSDQFLAILVNDNNVNQRLAQYHERVNMDARSIGIKYPIRFKTGIYQCKKHESNIDVMIDHANVARKSLNGDEKEMTAVYSDRIITNMQKTNRIESDMQHALATGEFKLFLQPKWDIYEDRICGAEALVRWIKADGTMVYPNEFIPIFENNGFVEKLDFYMLELVCQQIRTLMDVGRMIMPVSVNQSRLLLHSPDYVSNVEKIIKKYAIPENIIELEITETVFLDERELMIDTMNQLKKCGVRLAMDDFGSGYSSLNMLKDIPFDIIKIDRDFFSESVTSATSQWILQKIIEMSAGLGMEVICEGVETREQINLLQTIGCRRVQGYFYSKPIPAGEFVTKYCVVLNKR